MGTLTSTTDTVNEFSSDRVQARLGYAKITMLEAVDVLERLRGYTDEAVSKAPCPDPLSVETEKQIQELTKLKESLKSLKCDREMKGIWAQVHPEGAVLKQGQGTLHKGFQTCGRSCAEITYRLVGDRLSHVTKTRRSLENLEKQGLDAAEIAKFASDLRTDACVSHVMLRIKIENEHEVAVKFVKDKELDNLITNFGAQQLAPPRGEATVDSPFNTDDHDGFYPPTTWVFKGQTYKVPKNRVFNLLSTLYEVQNHTLEFSELAEPVFGDREADYNDGQIKSLRTRANRLLREHKLPFRVRIGARHIMLERN